MSARSVAPEFPSFHWSIRWIRYVDPPAEWSCHNKGNTLFQKKGCISNILSKKDCDLQVAKLCTPPKFNSSPLKNGGWKTIVSFWVSVTFYVRTVQLREGIREVHQNYHTFAACLIPSQMGNLDDPCGRYLDVGNSVPLLPQVTAPKRPSCECSTMRHLKGCADGCLTSLPPQKTQRPWLQRVHICRVWSIYLRVVFK